eukprot:CAMPEP_0196828118 /NCGR_PEP_ID=MMETSP1362-20130617/94514_1 /TAXON_ID=163516 /ORGANISM="Leptocylindrus danicus, Strain CCMP1856" /LENGTH=51 /DNA_ID=CAMNT_0042208785 /DNA_START=191 /DNA_END=346 /DNA_ORIENTATION=-
MEVMGILEVLEMAKKQQEDGQDCSMPRDAWDWFYVGIDLVETKISFMAFLD